MDHFVVNVFTPSVLAFPVLHHTAYPQQTTLFLHKNTSTSFCCSHSFPSSFVPFFIFTVCVFAFLFVVTFVHFSVLWLRLTHFFLFSQSLYFPLSMSSSLNHYSHTLHCFSPFPTMQLPSHSLYLSHYPSISLLFSLSLTFSLSPHAPYLTLSLSQYLTLSLSSLSPHYCAQRT